MINKEKQELDLLRQYEATQEKINKTDHIQLAGYFHALKRELKVIKDKLFNLRKTK